MICASILITLGIFALACKKKWVGIRDIGKEREWARGEGGKWERKREKVGWKKRTVLACFWCQTHVHTVQQTDQWWNRLLTRTLGEQGYECQQRKTTILCMQLYTRTVCFQTATHGYKHNVDILGQSIVYQDMAFPSKRRPRAHKFACAGHSLKVCQLSVCEDVFWTLLYRIVLGQHNQQCLFQGRRCFWWRPYFYHWKENGFFCAVIACSYPFVHISIFVNSSITSCFVTVAVTMAACHVTWTTFTC